jgi:protein TonB
MTRAETRTWAWALAASLTIHGALIWRVSTAAADGGQGTPAPVVTRVRFNSTGSAPSAPTTVTPPEPAKPKPPEKTKEKAAVPIPEPKPKASESTESAMAAAPTGSLASTAAVAGSASAAEVRQAWRNQLLAHIERKKFYPEAARRRGVTGGVRVEFIVGPGGTVSGLGCSAGPAVLNEAACEAVRRSVPLPLPPPEIAFPVSVSFIMEFALK